MEWLKEIADYKPYNIEEQQTKEYILNFCNTHENVLYRESCEGHMSSTGFVINHEHTKVLMAFHNIYQSYSWTGGHNDGDPDFKGVAEKEVREETGLANVKRISNLISLDDLPVETHIKKGVEVKEHRHFNLTYLFEADENAAVSIKEDENSAIKWIPFDEIENWVDEEIMIPVYKKIIERVQKRLYECIE